MNKSVTDIRLWFVDANSDQETLDRTVDTELLYLRQAQFTHVLTNADNIGEISVNIGAKHVLLSSLHLLLLLLQLLLFVVNVIRRCCSCCSSSCRYGWCVGRDGRGDQIFGGDENFDLDTWAVDAEQVLTWLVQNDS